MALEYRDRVVDAATTTGTGTFTLGGLPPAGFRDFTAFPTGATVRYSIVHENNTEWEVGEGVWTTSGATLTRVKVFASSNAGALVNFTAGSKTVSAGPVAADMQRPAFRAYRASLQSVTASKWTKVQLDTKEFDTASAFDNTTNFRFTPQVPGYYQFNGQVRTGSAPAQLVCALYKNGAAAAYSNNSASIDRSGVSDLFYMNGTTDFVELWVITTATSVSTFIAGADTRLSGVLVAPAP